VCIRKASLPGLSDHPRGASRAKEGRLLSLFDCRTEIGEVLFKASVADGLVNPRPALPQPFCRECLHLGQRLVVLPVNFDKDFRRHARAVARRHMCVFFHFISYFTYNFF
jgi:hypothetical protein